MPNQEQSRDGIPRKDSDRPSPDAERLATDGQASARGTGINTHEQDRSAPPQAAEEKGTARDSQSGSQDYRGDGPGKMGLTSDDQPDLVAPSGVNDRDSGKSGSAPVAGESLNFDDGTDMVHPRGKVTGAGRTANEENPSDAGDLGAPNAGLSDRNGPSDPDAKRGR
jgi:hypothetical protein